MLSSTKKQNALHCFTTKLEFRIDDTAVEFGGHICQQLVLYKKKTLSMTYIDIFGQDHLFVQVILSDTHSLCKFGTLLKVLTSITDM